MNNKYKVILWDFGGVLTQSPINNFSYFEKVNGFPRGTIIKINSRNYLKNAWALIEKNKITKKEFNAMFKKEAAEIGIDSIDIEGILSCLNPDINKDIYNIFKVIKKKYKCVCLTNNININNLPFKKSSFEKVRNDFFLVFESCKLGVRKPEEEIYKIVLKKLNIYPENILFLDDLGINLKPAKKLGINTYKVFDTQSTINYLIKELKL